VPTVGDGGAPILAEAAALLFRPAAAAFGGVGQQKAHHFVHEIVCFFHQPTL